MRSSDSYTADTSLLYRGRRLRTTTSCSPFMISPTRCVSCVVLAAALLAQPPAAAQSSDRDRRDPSTLLPLEELWTTNLPASPAAPPLHADSRIYVPLRDGQIVAVALLDGEVEWEAIQTVDGVPAIGGGLFYAATSNSLRALSLETGALVWQVSLPARLSAPLVWNNGWLIVALESQALLALAAETGETIWNRALGGVAHVRPALAADRMYVSLDNGGLLALSLRSGQLLWEQQFDGPPTEVLPLDDLFVGATDNHFYRLSSVDGSVKWRWRTGGDIIGRAAVDEERVYFSSLDNVVWALDRASGNQQWRQTLATRPTDGPGHADDLLVLAGLGQTLSFHDPEDGMLYGRMRAPTEVAFPPLVLTEPTLGAVVLYVTGDGRLRALAGGATPFLVEASVAPLFFKKPTAAASGNDDGDEDGAEAGPALISTLLPPPTLDGSPAPAGLTAVGAALMSTLLPPPTLDGFPAPAGLRAAGPGALPTGVSGPAPSGAPDSSLFTDVPAPAQVTAAESPQTETTVPSSAEAVPTEPPQMVRRGTGFAVQVAALTSRDSADAMVARLAAADLPAYVFEPAAEDRPQLFRVRIGDYPDRAAAEAVGRRVEVTLATEWYVVALP